MKIRLAVQTFFRLLGIWSFGVFSAVAADAPRGTPELHSAPISTKAVAVAETNTQPGERFSAPVYRQTSNKPFDDVIDDLLFAISQNNFRLTEHAKIGQAIAEREQISFPRISVLHFCNLSYAKTFIEMQPEAILHMPCRISVRQSGDRVIIETLLLDNTTPASDFVKHINQLLQSIVNSGAA